jgi:hypothetical protein
MRSVVTLVLLLGAATLLCAAEITVSSDPPLPVPNLIANGDCEQGAEGKAAQWSFGTATPSNFETAWRDDGRSGKCLWMKAKTGVMSGYFSQSVPVQPGRAYLFHGFFRLGAGRMLVYANSSIALPDGRRVAVDQRFYQGTMRGHWLVPVFLPPDALGGPDLNAWLPFRLSVNITESMTAVALSLGLYFQPGEVSFDDLWAGLGQTDLSVSVKAAAGETLSRVVMTPVGASKPVYDSGVLKAGTTEFSTLVKQQPTDAVYEVAVTRSDGQVTVRRYPEGEVR